MSSNSNNIDISILYTIYEQYCLIHNQNVCAYDDFKKIKNMNFTSVLVNKYRAYGIIELLPYNGETKLVIDNSSALITDDEKKDTCDENTYIISSHYKLLHNVSIIGDFSKDNFANLSKNLFDIITIKSSDNIAETDIFKNNLLRLLKNNGTVILNDTHIIQKRDDKLYMLSSGPYKENEYHINMFDIFDRASTFPHPIHELTEVPTLQITNVSTLFKTI